MSHRLLLAGLLAGLLTMTTVATAQDEPAPPSEAEQFFPQHGFLLTGYGGAGYSARFAEDGDVPNDFSVVFAPIMLFQVSDRFLFESEFEFELEGGVSATELEYAQVDLTLNNNLTLIAGKFLLPFAAFGERLHPTWINRLPTAPAVYGAHGGVLPTDPMLPVLSDIGVQLQGNFSVSRFNNLSAAVYVTQGPTPGGDAHAEEEETHDELGEGGEQDEDGHDIGEQLVGLSFGGDATDNNTNKMVGGRLGYSVSPYFEVDVSALTGMYDSVGDRRFSAFAVHAAARYGPFTLHGELIQTRQDLLEAEENHDEGEGELKGETEEEGHTDSLTRNGYWVQAAYQWGKWESVVRWSQLFEAEVEGTTLVASGRQLSVGVNYWIESSLALKVAYVLNDEGGPNVANNGVAVQLAFGF